MPPKKQDQSSAACLTSARRAALANNPLMSRQFWRLAGRAKLGYEVQAMNAATLKAHYDGKHICLDDPDPLEPNTRLLVTAVPGDTTEEERQAGLASSPTGFARGYGEKKAEYFGADTPRQPPRE